MYARPSSRPEGGPNPLMIVGWIALILIGAGLTWYGFTAAIGDQPSADADPTQPPGALTPQVISTAPGAGVPTIPIPTNTPEPTPTPPPTPIPPTPTPALPSALVGASGVNVRTGPNTNYNLLVHLEPGTVVPITGRYSDWWQIQYSGGVGWVFGQLVTPSNTETVPQVQPPPAPPTAIPPTAIPTSIPPTPVPVATPTPPLPANVRGLVASSFFVENAPGPFGSTSDIWFNFEVRNASGGAVSYSALGAYVQETDQFQRSWTNNTFNPSQVLTWRDHLNQFSLGSGTYHLWLRICWSDGGCDLLKGPVEIRIQ